MDFTTTAPDHIFASFQERNNKKKDFPEINLTFFKISRSKYIKEFEETSLSFRNKQGK